MNWLTRVEGQALGATTGSNLGSDAGISDRGKAADFLVHGPDSARQLGRESEREQSSGQGSNDELGGASLGAAPPFLLHRPGPVLPPSLPLHSPPQSRPTASLAPSELHAMRPLSLLPPPENLSSSGRAKAVDPAASAQLQKGQRCSTTAGTR